MLMARRANIEARGPAGVTPLMVCTVAENIHLALILSVFSDHNRKLLQCAVISKSLVSEFWQQ
jgi:hypothetical protein